MSVDTDTVRRVAKLARIAVPEEDLGHLAQELNGILDWVEHLAAVDVEGVEPMSAVTPMMLKMRDDAVTDGGIADQVLGNAPDSREGFYAVPKVVE